MTPTRLRPALLVFLFAALPGVATAQGLEAVKANYTKYEYRIPMRDGKKLFTAVYVPKDTSQKYPILMTRTPYSVGPYGIDRYRDHLGPSDFFARSGYVFAYQDVRGRWMSEGTFVNMRPHNPDKKGPQDIDESSDTYDTIDWLVKHIPNNNGKVGLTGISYPGFYTDAGMIDAHPALKAASPQAPIVDWFVGDDFHRNGALWLPHFFNFIADFGRPRPEPTRKGSARFEHDTQDGYAFFLRLGPLANADRKYFKGNVAFWNDVMAHGNYDEFWQSRNLRPHLKNIKPAVMTVGGWFDAENLFGALQTYRTVEANSPGITNTLVMGPWFHGQWAGGGGESLGNVHFNSKTSDFFREHIEFPFFEYHLKGKGENKHPEAWVFETGTNQWRKHDAWPPKTAKARAFYLRAGGGLVAEAPPDGKAGSGSGDTPPTYDEYISDPAKPVPFEDQIDIGMSREYMTADQRFAARRPDVLVYKTPPLEADTTFAGPIDVDLYVSTTGTDSDWVVKVIDVYPDDYPNPDPNPMRVRMGGYQQLVRGEVMRGKFRNSYSKPEPFEPGKPTRVKYRMNDIYHTFRPGHRIMVQVQSSWFPLCDRNPQKFVDIYSAKESDFQKATQRVYRSSELPSKVTVLVMP
jgi:putative CocE/NonD family hydrolase